MVPSQHPAVPFPVHQTLMSKWLCCQRNRVFGQYAQGVPARPAYQVAYRFSAEDWQGAAKRTLKLRVAELTEVVNTLRDRLSTLESEPVDTARS